MNPNLEVNKCEEKFCYRKGVFCFECSHCNSDNCSRQLPDLTVVATELVGDVTTDEVQTVFYTQAYVDELKQERDKYKELYETMYRKWSELETKDLNKKYAEAIASDYLNKNAELIGNIMTMYDRLKEAMLVRDISYGSEPAEEDVEIITWWQVAKQFKELFNIGDYKDE